jgi:hypothetical protein
MHGNGIAGRGLRWVSLVEKGILGVSVVVFFQGRRWGFFFLCFSVDSEIRGSAKWILEDDEFVSGRTEIRMGWGWNEKGILVENMEIDGANRKD